ncbi:hypothetical protein D3C76_1556590 [compost metagenome]
MNGQGALVTLGAVAGGDRPLLEDLAVHIELAHAQGAGKHHMADRQHRPTAPIGRRDSLIPQNKLEGGHRGAGG